MLCEIFCTILSQGTTSNKVNVGDRAGICHSFIAIDPKLFGDPEDIKNVFSGFLQELRDAPKAEGESRIYTHGEKEHFAFADRMQNGVEVNINTVAEMRNLADYLKMDTDSYLGEMNMEVEYESSY